MTDNNHEKKHLSLWDWLIVYMWVALSIAIIIYFIWYTLIRKVSHRSTQQQKMQQQQPRSLPATSHSSKDRIKRLIPRSNNSSNGARKTTLSQRTRRLVPKSTSRRS